MKSRRESKYLKMAAASFASPLVVVAPDLRILAVNPAAARLHHRDVVGKRYVEVFTDKSRFCPPEVILKVVETGGPVSSPMRHPVQGHDLTRHAYGWPIVADGALEAIACTAFELPGVSQALRKMELSNTYLLSLIQSTADAVVAADMSGKIRIYNQNAEKIFGYPAKEVLAGMNIRDLYPDDQAREVMSKLRSDRHGGKGKLFHHAVNILARGDVVIPVVLNAAIIYERDREVSSIGFFHDQRGEILLREELEKSRSLQAASDNEGPLGRLFDGMTHQLEFYNMRFGEIALNLGMIDQEQLDRARQERDRLEKASQMPVPIGRVMIQMEFLTEEQRETIMEMQSIADAVTTAPEDPSAGGAPGEDDEASILVDDRRLEARLQVTPGRRADITAAEVRRMLAERKVVFGVVGEAEIKAYLEAEEAPERALLLARGRPPIPPEPPKTVFHFDTDPLKIGRLRSDGTMDWKDRGEIPQAEPGDVLAELVPGKPGIPGRDVFNEVIPVPLPDDGVLQCGEGVALSEDGLKYLATIHGHVRLSMDGTLNVFSAMRIDGDVCNETGHVEFLGHVEISGAVRDGFSVKGKSLRVREIQGAEIVIADDMDVLGGIYDSHVIGGGHLKVSHIHNSTIDLAGDLAVKKEIIDSEVETAGGCDIRTGRIVSSRVTAFKGIVAHQVGTEASLPSTLKVGIHHQNQKARAALQEERAELKVKQKKLAVKRDRLQQRAEEVSELLGHIAQEQDRLMVQLQQAAASPAPPETSGTADAAAAVPEEMLGQLTARKADIDARVEALLTEDEEIEKTLSRVDAGIEKLKREVDRVNERLAELEREEGSGAGKGRASVRVDGDVMPKTVIEGPAASVRLEEPLRRVLIQETDQTSEQGRVKRVMEVAPIR